MKNKRFITSLVLMLVSAVLLSTASFAWFSMNESVNVAGFQLEAYSDSLFLQVSESREGPYSTGLDLSEREEEARRLVTLAHLTVGGVTVEESEITDGTLRYSSDSGINYYKKVKTDSERNDTLEGDNYILISGENGKLRDASLVAGYYKVGPDAREITFTVITDTKLTYDGTSDYYRKVGNTYYKLHTPDDDGKLDVDELAAGEHLRGFYTVTLGTPESEGARYDGSSLYYNIDDGGSIAPVGALSLGSLLKGYYTVNASEPVTTADGESKYYVKNDRDDYVCIGIPAKDTNLEDYYYWGRAYSASMSAVGEDKTLSVIKEEHLESYYLKDTLYLRLASLDAHGSNLRVGSVDIAGNDSLSNAIRVYITAKNGNGEEARAVYNNRTGEITHLDDLDGNGENDNLFAQILGSAEEIVEVEVYIYFDGTDPSARSEDAVLSGYSVSVKFEIDLPDYMQ